MEAKTLNEHAEQIRQNHTTAVECERQAEEMGKEQGKQSIQAAIACGNNLKAAKKMLKHGEWLPWLAQNCPEISSDTCQRYMKLAKASYGMTDLTEKASLRQAYVATGVIKEKKPRTGAGSSSGERDKFSVENERARRLSKFLAVCDKATTAKMMDAVKPIVEWYNSQLQQIQKREAALNDGFPETPTIAEPIHKKPMGYQCNSCEEKFEDDSEAVSLYECGECGTQFTRETSVNGNHQCPDCNKFGAKISDCGCPSCNEGELEEIGNENLEEAA